MALHRIIIFILIIPNRYKLCDIIATNIYIFNFFFVFFYFCIFSIFLNREDIWKIKILYLNHGSKTRNRSIIRHTMMFEFYYASKYITYNARFDRSYDLTIDSFCAISIILCIPFVLHLPWNFVNLLNARLMKANTFIRFINFAICTRKIHFCASADVYFHSRSPWFMRIYEMQYPCYKRTHHGIILCL